MNLKQLVNLYSDNGCSNVHVKTLAPNDNSKNQVYLGGSFEVLNILPVKEVIADNSGDWKTIRFKTKIDFYWLSEEGNLLPVRHSQFILYPNYPEVRFSGFLLGCLEAPSELMTSRLSGRLLFFGATPDKKILGYVCEPESELAQEFNLLKDVETEGVFKVISILGQNLIRDSKRTLLLELKRIHQLGWITSKKLNSTGNVQPCEYSNCGGYTLEAELGIRPNSNSEPDFLGWELKQFNVKKFELYRSKVITLMTPEPTDGYYADKGVRKFIERFGYKDKMGRPDRMNFGGVHKVGIVHNTTGLKLELDGFDFDTGVIKNANGAIVLLTKNDTVAASWSFTTLIEHWNQKHNKSCYVPSTSRKIPLHQYFYGNKIILGSDTDFILFLKQMAIGNVYYDPGIKLENISKDPIHKARSQFRVKSGFLPNLYRKNEIIDVLNDAF